MKTVGIIPVKSFARAKSRLSRVLRDDERADLAHSFFLHVLQVAEASAAFARVLVVTDGDDVAELALARGADVLRDPTFRGASCLGDVVDAAIGHVVGEADAVFVTMGDLPLLEVSDVSLALASLANVDLVLAPDHREEGTNALALRTTVASRATRTAFGRPDSFARHCAMVPPGRLTVHRSRGLAFDVDTTQDLLRLEQRAMRPSGEKLFEQIDDR
jgi:2-phospho-L-lactate guanylyltransferase